ncbi:tryptophan synthase subunit beta [Candidatus Peregrinibacteria bacterium]|nr:MAG: tryptophan synthase subunit beta [Candidatus Peregrinibacteria bacterium]
MSFRKSILTSNGHFGSYGGQYVSEMLIPIMLELSDAFEKAITDESFRKDFLDIQQNYAGRPTPLYFAENLTKILGGAKIFLKNEGLVHTGAHKMNHCLGQGLLAKRMGKMRVIAETGAGQHGLATATMCAKLGLECVIYMGAKDVARQRPNVFWMEKLGATVIPVENGGQVLRDAINEALRDLVTNPYDTLYLLGTVCGPHPYPKMNTYFQKIISEEVRMQLQKQTGRVLPDAVVACVGGGSNAMGAFFDFLDDMDVQLIGVEAGGLGIEGKDHAARFVSGKFGGSAGVSEGMKSYFLQNEDGQMRNTHSICAGLDYSGVSPIHAWLRDEGRTEYVVATDEEALEGWKMLVKHEGIIPALESAHAVAEGVRRAKEMQSDQILVINVSGRGDKDLFITTKAFGDEGFTDFLRRTVQNL